MKKVLISAFIGSNNLGDEAIFKSICQSLAKDKNLEVSAFTLSGRNSTKNGVRMINSYNPIRIINEIKNCDLLVCGGGGLILDQINIYNLLRHMYKVIIAKFLGVKYMFYAVGVETLMFSFNKALTRFICKNALAITVRDKKSKRNLLELGVSSSIIATSDPVVNLNINNEKAKISFQQPYIAVCLRHWFDINSYLPVVVVKKFNLRSAEGKRKYENFLDQIAKFLDYVVDNHKVRLIFLPFFHGRDEKVHQEVIDRMKNKNNCTNITRKITIPEADKIISKAEMLVGMRLHAQIFSAKNYVPFLSLVYLEKVTGFLEELGFPQWGIDVNKLDREKLIDRFEAIYSQKDMLKKQLKLRMSVLKRNERSNYKILSGLLKNIT